MNVFVVRAGTQDPYTVQQVIDENGYGLPDEFDSESIVIDLGANIGCFAAACLERGAGRVECFEIENQNFAMLRRNLRYYGDRAVLHQKAAWRSDEAPSADPDKCKVVYILNHGALTAMHHCFGTPEQGAQPIPTIGLDAILEPYKTVDLLKIDIEGCEFHVLFTSKLLDRVKRIVGEIHPAFSFAGEPSWDCTNEGVKRFLEGQGFDVELKDRGHPALAMEFDAVRNGPASCCSCDCGGEVTVTELANA